MSICFSAGVGRTGTYITLDNVLDQIEAEGLVGIEGVIAKARNQRMKMVQTKVNRYNPFFVLNILHNICVQCSIILNTVHRECVKLIIHQYISNIWSAANATLA